MFKYSLINRKQVVKFTSTHTHCSIPQKKDGDISKGKGRRWLGAKIYSIPCRASCFASVDLKEKDEFNLLTKSTKAKQLARKRNWRKLCPPNRRDDLCLCFCFHPSFMGKILGLEYRSCKLSLYVQLPVLDTAQQPVAQQGRNVAQLG